MFLNILVVRSLKSVPCCFTMTRYHLLQISSISEHSAPAKTTTTTTALHIRWNRLISVQRLPALYIFFTKGLWPKMPKASFLRRQRQRQRQRRPTKLTLKWREFFQQLRTHFSCGDENNDDDDDDDILSWQKHSFILPQKDKNFCSHCDLQPRNHEALAIYLWPNLGMMMMIIMFTDCSCIVDKLKYFTPNQWSMVSLVLSIQMPRRTSALICKQSSRGYDWIYITVPLGHSALT